MILCIKKYYSRYFAGCAATKMKRTILRKMFIVFFGDVDILRRSFEDICDIVGWI
jgi:hypothetical protein